MPIGPIHGKTAVRGFLKKFGASVSRKGYDLERILVSGDIAAVEGVENYEKLGKTVRLPFMSMFRFEAGKMCEWRDYFDLQTVLRQAGLPLGGSRPARGPAAPGP